MAARIRNSLTLFSSLREVENIEIRLHQTVLYNSIYHADDQLLVNQHSYGVLVDDSPIFSLRKVEGDDMFSGYLNSFERIWSAAALRE